MSENEKDYDSDLEYKGDLTVKSLGGLSKDKVMNIDQLQVIESLIKCPICLEILNNPFECEICGCLFCEFCIQNWLKAKECCPMKCTELKIKRADINARKLLNVIVLKCQNFPDCSFTSNYWDLFEHEEKCPYQRIKCPNKPCKFSAKYSELKTHLKTCIYGRIECAFCNAVLSRKEFDEHLHTHQIKKTFYKKVCNFCGSSENLRRCTCNEVLCFPCIEESSISGPHKECCHFTTGSNVTTKIYNVSKHPLPRNFEARISFPSVNWIRTGITFDKGICELEEDANCPPFDIYCILEDLKQFYTMKNKWRYIFKNKDKQLTNGDSLTMRFKNGELRYALNGEDLGNVVKINLADKKDFYLFVQCRTDKSRAKVEYISEIFS